MFPLMLSALHSVLIDVRDLDPAVRDYSCLLGGAPHHLESSSTGSTRSAFFRVANTSLELRAGRDVDASQAAEAERRDGEFGQTGLRFRWDEGDPVSVLGARGVRLAAGHWEEASVEGALGARRWCRHVVDPTSSRGLPVELISEEQGVEIVSPGPETAGSSWPPEAGVRALDHVVVLSPDVEATRAFYADGLGLRLALDRSFEERGVRLLFFRVGGTTVEIGSRLGADARPDRPDRFGGLAWQVFDLDAIRARLVANGFDVSGIRDGNKPGTRVCTVRDRVHGMPTLLIEPVA